MPSFSAPMFFLLRRKCTVVPHSLVLLALKMSWNTEVQMQTMDFKKGQCLFKNLKYFFGGWEFSDLQCCWGSWHLYTFSLCLGRDISRPSGYCAGESKWADQECIRSADTRYVLCFYKTHEFLLVLYLVFYPKNRRSKYMCSWNRRRKSPVQRIFKWPQPEPAFQLSVHFIWGRATSPT